MLKKTICEELDSNLAFYRKLDISLHKKRLAAIFRRKNIFDSDHSTSIYTNQYMKYKNQADKANFQLSSLYDYHQARLIKNNNDILYNKIKKIRVRDNSTLANDKLIGYIKTRNKFFDYVRKAEQKKIEENNKKFSKRLSSSVGYINSKRLEEEFQANQKLFLQLKKVKPLRSFDKKDAELSGNNGTCISINEASTFRNSVGRTRNGPRMTKNNSAPVLPLL